MFWMLLFKLINPQLHLKGRRIFNVLWFFIHFVTSLCSKMNNYQLRNISMWHPDRTRGSWSGLEKKSFINIKECREWISYPTTDGFREVLGQPSKQNHVDWPVSWWRALHRLFIWETKQPWGFYSEALKNGQLSQLLHENFLDCNCEIYPNTWRWSLYQKDDNTSEIIVQLK